MYDSRSRVCNACGTTFIPAPMHQFKTVYKRKTYIACCYSCFVRIKADIDKQRECNRRQQTN
jgi:hypothetical protein